jgi:DNA-binding CsgD family transcriptional regulator
MLRGRRDECAALDQALQRIRAGQSAVLVVRGEAGIGKTALLEHAAEHASDCKVIRAAGVEAEMELAFAGLHQLCAPVLDGLEGLPAPQQDALRVAFGLREGDTPDTFLVALAALSLLAEAAEAQPLVCLFDDAQWLDRASAQVLAFVARRLLAERIAMVFAVREPSTQDELAGLPELVVAGLPEPDARALLESVVPGLVDARVRDRILAETRGNPLALLELPRGLTPAELAGGFGLPDTRPLAGRIEHSFLARTRQLPAGTQRLLLVAAAEPLGDAGLLWRAAERLGVGADAGGPAEAAGLIELGARARFAHPLIRSAVYRAADPRGRRDAHAALASATDPDLDPDRRAWHRAHATATPDEAVAAMLERSADRAARRSGVAAAAAFLQRAAELTPDPAARAARALAAAQAKLNVADAATAADLVSAARIGPVDALQRAQLDRIAARIAFLRRRGRDAPPLLLDAARRLAPHDAALARETCLEAFEAALLTGRLASAEAGVRAVAETALAIPAAAEPAPGDQLLDALVTRFTDGYAAAAAPLAAAVHAYAQPGGGVQADGRWLGLACRLAQDLWDDDLWERLATDGVAAARASGALGLLPVAANQLAAFSIHSGSFETADSLIDEVAGIADATGLEPLRYAWIMRTALRGDEAHARPLFDAAAQSATERGEGAGLGVLRWQTATLHNANGRYAQALEAARSSCEHEDLMAYGPALAELVEAGVRGGRPDEAALALHRLRERTRAAGTDWALGVEARCRALVGDDEATYREAVERLAASRAALELARSRLLYGEWLRRANRRTDAREQLRAAHEDFERFGAAAFAERARRELLATGETVRRVTADARDALTPQEVQVARLARDGHTNPEIGAQLFISPRTVEYHLHKVYRKLDVSTRRQLRDALEEQAA